MFWYFAPPNIRKHIAGTEFFVAIGIHEYFITPAIYVMTQAMTAKASIFFAKMLNRVIFGNLPCHITDRMHL